MDNKEFEKLKSPLAVSEIHFHRPRKMNVNGDEIPIKLYKPLFRVPPVTDVREEKKREIYYIKIKADTRNKIMIASDEWTSFEYFVPKRNNSSFNSL